MELKFSPLSPYVRKVMIVAHELGITDRIRLTKLNTRAEPEKITPLNPLGKIPTLITDSGAILYDSPVICEYLDAEYGGHRLLPAAGARRWEILTCMALGDGLIDAAIIVRHERAREKEKQSDEWSAWQLHKVEAGLQVLEERVDTFGDALDLGQITIACALGYMPLRLEELVGFTRWPRLRGWYDTLSQRASLKATVPVL
jgi:glutathione S-transferase